MHHNSTIEAAAIAPIAFAVERADILPALDIMKRRIIARGNSPVLAGVKIEAMPGCVKLTATDCDIMLAIDIPAHVETPGACVLDCDNLRKLVNKSDKRAEIRLSIADGYATVISARARNRLPTVQLDEFPVSIAPIGETESTFTLSADMVQALDYVAPFASTEDATRGHLRGVALQSDGTTATMIATAGHVLSFAEFDAPDGMGEHAVLPNKTIAAIQALTKGKSAPLSVETTKEGAVIRGDNWTLTTKQVDGTFPQWRRVLPAGEMEGLLMPELAPNLNPGFVESFKKTIPGPLSWELGAPGCGDAWVARIKSADVPNWTGLLCTTKEQVAPNGYNFEGETVEVDGKEYPVATSSRGIHLTAETVRAPCGTPEELAVMQARHDALTKARKSLAYPVFKGDATADCYRSPAYLAHLAICQRVTDQRRAFELAAARGHDADDCLAAAWDATATPIEAIAPVAPTPIAEIAPVAAQDPIPALAPRPRTLVQELGVWSGSMPDAEGAFVSIKHDGWRMSRSDMHRTRNGMPFRGIAHIERATALLQAQFDVPMVFDGEFVVDDPDTLAATKAHQDSGWKAGNAGRFWIFDCLPLDAWQRDDCDWPLHRRLAALAEGFAMMHADPLSWECGWSEGVECPLMMVENAWMVAPSEVQDAAQRVWAGGGEGIVIKRHDALYRRNRNNDWLKLKQGK